jgi:hypothetical protein
MPKFLFRIVLALAFPIGAISQTAQPPCSGMGNFGIQSPAITRTGAGKPYSLTASIKTEMKLFDGNTISGFAISHQARDSQGRTRAEDLTHCAIDKDHQPYLLRSITLTAPVAKTYTLWQENFGGPTKFATVTHVPSVKISAPPTAQQEIRMAQQLSQSFEQSSDHGTQYKVEDLGKRNIAGLGASGMRITRILAVGMEGNSLPLTHVEEKWVSDDYGIILLDIQDDPMFGRSTYEVTDFTPGEPEASLFQLPADYKINERTLTQ